MQLAQGALSRLHSKLELLSLETKVKVAVLAVVLAAGPLVIVVCGGVVSAAAARADGDGEEVSLGAVGAGLTVRGTSRSVRVG
jgi:hypothetical protein